MLFREQAASESDGIAADVPQDLWVNSFIMQGPSQSLLETINPD